MVDKIDDGGSGYPVPENNYVSDGTYSNPGMSLRDWFAGQALAGRLANKHQDQYTLSDHAEISYLVADAMLEARKAGA